MIKARSALLAFATVTFATALATAQTVDRSGVGAMVTAINSERARQNLPALASDPRLDAVAEGHSLDMARGRFFSHTSPTTGQPAERVTEAGLSWTTVAENIAINQTPQAAQQSLVRSPGHYQNMVDPNQRSVGIGIVRHGDQVWVTQLFAALNGPAPAPAVTVPPAGNTAPVNEPDDDSDEEDSDESNTGCGRSDHDEVAAAPQAPVAPAAPVAPITPAAPIPAQATMPWQAIPGLDQFLTGLGMTRQPVAPQTSAQTNQRAPSHQVYVVQTPFGPVRVEVPGAVAAPSVAPAARHPAAAPAPAPRTHRRAPARGRVVQVDTLDV